MKTQLALLFVSVFVLSACKKPIEQTTLQPVPTTKPSEEENNAEPGGVLGVQVGEPVGGQIGGVVGDSTFSPCDPKDTSENPCGLDPVPLKVGIVPPKKIPEKCKSPVYPEKARAANLEGSVKLKVTVDKEGKTTSVVFLDGTPEFVEAATTYLKNCEFTPATFNDKPIAVNKLEIVSFKLK
jgi:TonB family protein